MNTEKLRGLGDKYQIVWTARFKREYKLAEKRGLKISKLDDIIRVLAKGAEPPASMLDHPLKGKWKNHRELHIEDDWLLIYRRMNDILVLELTRTGSHADLFGE